VKIQAGICTPGAGYCPSELGQHPALASSSSGPSQAWLRNRKPPGRGAQIWWKSGNLLAGVAAKQQWPLLGHANFPLISGHPKSCCQAESPWAAGLLQMKSKLKDDDVLEKAIGGIPRVARIIVGMPPDERRKALGAVEYSYRRTALELGFAEGQARGWASVVMLSLRAERQDSHGRKRRSSYSLSLKAG
jgi:hypothetical protein